MFTVPHDETDRLLPVCHPKFKMQQVARLQRRHLAVTHYRSASFFAVPPNTDKPRASTSLGAEESLPLVTRPKPSETAWYTGSPGFHSVLNRLQEKLHETRADLHEKSILAEYSANPTAALRQLGLDTSKNEDQSAWLQQDRMALQLGTTLSLSQYRKLTSLLNALRALKPHVQLADTLGMPYSNGQMAAELEHLLASYRRTALDTSTTTVARGKAAKHQLDKHGRSYAVGRRKESSAQAWIIPANTEAGPGQVLINAKSLSDYFASPTTRDDILQPLKLTGSLGKFNIFALSRGGGPSGQAGALRLAIAKALLPFVDQSAAAALKKGVFFIRLSCGVIN